MFKTIKMSTLCMPIAMLMGLSCATGESLPPIKIGTFLALSGQGAFLGDPSKKIIELDIEKINASGGVLGRKLELIIYDTATSAKDAVTLVKRLVEQDRVDILIGGNITGEAMAIIPLAQASKLPLVSLAGGTPVTEPAKEWVFKTPRTDRLALKKILQHIEGKHMTKIGVLSGSGGFDKSCHAELQKLAPQHRIQIVADESHSTGDSDMTAQLTKIRAAGVEALVYCGFGSPTSIVAKNHRQLALSFPLYQTHGAASQQFIDGAAGGAEGTFVSASALLFADEMSDGDPQKTVTLSLIRDYRARYNTDADIYVGYAHDALMLAVDAIKRADGTNPAKVREALESTKGFSGATGVYSMSPTDHMGLTADSFRVVVVKNNRFTLAK